MTAALRALRRRYAANGRCFSRVCVEEIEPMDCLRPNYTRAGAYGDGCQGLRRGRRGLGGCRVYRRGSGHGTCISCLLCIYMPVIDRPLSDCRRSRSSMTRLTRRGGLFPSGIRSVRSLPRAGSRHLLAGRAIGARRAQTQPTLMRRRRMRGPRRQMMPAPRKRCALSAS